MSVQDLENTPLKDWTVEHVCAWLKSLSFLFGEYVPSFKRDPPVTGPVLATMTRDKLVNTYGVSVTDARFISLKLSTLVRKQKNLLPSKSPSSPSGPTAKPQPPDSRKQATHSQLSPSAARQGLVAGGQTTTSTLKLTEMALAVAASNPSPREVEAKKSAEQQKAATNGNGTRHARAPTINFDEHPIEAWSTAEVVEWLHTLHEDLHDYIPMFEENDVDGASLVDLTADDFEVDLGFQAKHASLLFGRLKKLKTTQTLLRKGLKPPPSPPASGAVQSTPIPKVTLEEKGGDTDDEDEQPQQQQQQPLAKQDDIFESVDDLLSNRASVASRPKSLPPPVAGPSATTTTAPAPAAAPTPPAAASSTSTASANELPPTPTTPATPPAGAAASPSTSSDAVAAQDVTSASNLPADPRVWGVAEVCAWLKSLSFLFDDHIPTVAKKGMNGQQLLSVTAPILEQEYGFQSTAARFAILKLSSLQRGLKKTPVAASPTPKPTQSTPQQQPATSSAAAPVTAISSAQYVSTKPPTTRPAAISLAKRSTPGFDLKTPLEQWSVEQVCNWLQYLSFVFNEHIPIFRSTGVDGATLIDLTEDDLIQELDMNPVAASYCMAKLKDLKSMQQRDRGATLSLKSSSNVAEPLHKTMEKGKAKGAAPGKKAKEKGKTEQPQTNGGLEKMLDSDDDEAANSGGAADAKEAAIWGDWGFSEEHGAKEPEHFMFSGSLVLKYGRFGKPKKKYICVSKDRKIVWGPTVEEIYIKRDGAMARSSASIMDLNSLKDILVGKRTKVLERKVAKEAPFDHCFSLVFPKRTLDFECNSAAMAAKWVRGLQLWLGVRQHVPKGGH